MSNNDAFKKCFKCSIRKNVSEFNKNKARLDGLSTYCTICSRISLKEFYSKKENRVRVNAVNQSNLALKRGAVKCDCCSREDIIQFYIGRPDGLTVDHIIPCSKGGLHCLHNMQYLTRSQNSEKGFS